MKLKYKRPNMQSTSLLAYAGILGSLGERQIQVYRAISDLKSCSNTMISQYLHLPINCIVGRTNELRKMRVVRQDKKDMCPVTNKLVIFWRVARRL